MTTPGPDHFFSCLACQAVLRRRTIGSGNTFGSTLWSDGYLDAPMMPEPVQVTCCPNCHHAFFVNDADDLGRYWTYRYSGAGGKDEIPAGYEEAPYIEEADAYGYRRVIADTTSVERLRYLRLQLWHTDNHPYRIRKPTGSARQRSEIRHKYFVENLDALLALLEDDRGSDQIMKAEVLRQLERYAEAIELLEDIDPDLSWVTAQIRIMAIERSSTVGILLRPGEDGNS